MINNNNNWNDQRLLKFERLNLEVFNIDVIPIKFCKILQLWILIAELIVESNKEKKKKFGASEARIKK